MIGTVVGSYRVTRLLGEGGMGAVYEGFNEAIERRVAIKVLKEEFAAKPDVVERFFNEARAANRVNHPNIVQIHEHGQLPGGGAYIIMELLEGSTLGDRAAKSGGKLPVKSALEIAWQVAAALSAAHHKGIVHRDLKPGNLMLVPDPLGPGGERVKVLDFGIAKLLADTHGMTSSHAVMGTPMYMSPEQCRGAGAVDAKADVYSLGAILFQLIAGRPPFVAEAVGEIIGMHLFQPPPHLRKYVPDIPPEIGDFVHELLGKDKDRRPPMDKVAHRLTQLVADFDAATKKTPHKSDRRRNRSGALWLIAGSFLAGGLILYVGLPSQRAASVADLAPAATVPPPKAPPVASPVASPVARVEPPPAAPAISGPRAVAPSDPEKLINEAQKQYTAGRYDKAIELARSAQRGSPERAWRIIGSAACALRDRPLVDESLSRLDALSRKYVTDVCGRHGLHLGEELFKPVK
jgi:serine/threonine protein kinase